MSKVANRLLERQGNTEAMADLPRKACAAAALPTSCMPRTSPPSAWRTRRLRLRLPRHGRRRAGGYGVPPDK